jgi:hypothetical protein
MNKRLIAFLSVVSLSLSSPLIPANAAVSKTAFQDALSQLEVFQDEFVGNYEIYGKPNSDYWTQDEDDNYFDLSLDLVKNDAKSKWKMVMVTYYSGEDWIFHDELNLKSSKGKLNLKVPNAGRDADDGTVSENGALSLTNSQRLSYCKIVGGNNVTFRLRGNAGSVTGIMQDGSISHNLALCTVYQGLLQGYKPIL